MTLSSVLQIVRYNVVWVMGIFFVLCVLIAARSRWRVTAGAAQGLAIAILTLMFVEVALRLIDPWGSWAYQQDVVHFFYQTAPHPTRGFVLRDGVLIWANGSQATIQDGHRWTPHSQAGDCQIVVVGDSVTFGWAIGDEEVYVDLLARRFPQVDWENAAIASYDDQALRAVYDETPADGYLYLMINNDLTGPGLKVYRAEWQQVRPTSALRGYQHLLVQRAHAASLEISPAVWENLAFVSNPRVLAFTVDQDDSALWAARERFGADLVVLPLWSETISFADVHPSAKGHEELAASMEPYVEAWLPTVCGGGGGTIEGKRSNKLTETKIDYPANVFVALDMGKKRGGIYEYPYDFRIWCHHWGLAFRIVEDSDYNKDTLPRFGWIDFGTVEQFWKQRDQHE